MNKGSANKQGKRLDASDQPCIYVYIGATFQQLDEQSFALNPASAEDFQQLFMTLDSQGILPDEILYLWGLDIQFTDAWAVADFAEAQVLTSGRRSTFVQSTR